MNGNFRVGEFLIEPQLNSITRAERTARIEPKVMQVLLCLAEHAGEVLPKETLMQSVWPDTFVTDDVLTRSISELRKAFDDDAKEPRFIQTIPRSGYRLVAPVSYDQSTKEKKDVPASVEPNKRRRSFLAAGILAGVLLLAVAAWFWWPKRPDTPQPALTAVPLTTDPGYEGMPSLSPDGNQVAYVSDGGHPGNLDIYVKLIGGGPAVRLTSDPSIDRFPAWSPDGRSIAFLRQRGEKLDVLLIPALGGLERKLAETAPGLPNYSARAPYLSWFPDSQHLMTVDRASPGDLPSLFVLTVETGEKRRLTTPADPALFDNNPAVSPDGRTLAFVRVTAYGHAQLLLVPLLENCQPAGEPRPLDLPQPWVYGPTWTPDGQNIICSLGSFAKERMWRVPVSGSQQPQPLGSVGENGEEPTISRQGNRLVYTVGTEDGDIWRAEISGRAASGPAAKLIASTRDESNAAYSPNGSRIVFSSERSGYVEIWVCNGDGSNPAPLTSMRARSIRPAWFPDGRRIVFDCLKEGQIDIYAIDIDTRVPRRLTNDPGGGAPCVSHDGNWIYFSSSRTGRMEIWRVPAEGGDTVQVTRDGGFMPVDSPDGRMLYYQKGVSNTDVWTIPEEGGQETRVFGPVRNMAFAVVRNGIYFVGPEFGYGIGGNFLGFFSFDNGTTEKLFDIKNPSGMGVSVSPDGRYVLFSQKERFDCDLMLVDNFR